MKIIFIMLFLQCNLAVPEKCKNITHKSSKSSCSLNNINHDKNSFSKSATNLSFVSLFNTNDLNNLEDEQNIENLEPYQRQALINFCEAFIEIAFLPDFCATSKDTSSVLDVHSFCYQLKLQFVENSLKNLVKQNNTKQAYIDKIFEKINVHEIVKNTQDNFLHFSKDILSFRYLIANTIYRVDCNANEFVTKEDFKVDGFGGFSCYQYFELNDRFQKILTTFEENLENFSLLKNEKEMVAVLRKHFSIGAYIFEICKHYTFKLFLYHNKDIFFNNKDEKIQISKNLIIFWEIIAYYYCNTCGSTIAQERDDLFVKFIQSFCGKTYEENMEFIKKKYDLLYRTILYYASNNDSDVFIAQIKFLSQYEFPKSQNFFLKFMNYQNISNFNLGKRCLVEFFKKNSTTEKIHDFKYDFLLYFECVRYNLIKYKLLSRKILQNKSIYKIYSNMQDEFKKIFVPSFWLNPSIKFKYSKNQCCVDIMESLIQTYSYYFWFKNEEEKENFDFATEIVLQILKNLYFNNFFCHIGMDYKNVLNFELDYKNKQSIISLLEDINFNDQFILNFFESHGNVFVSLYEIITSKANLNKPVKANFYNIKNFIAKVMLATQNSPENNWTNIPTQSLRHLNKRINKIIHFANSLEFEDQNFIPNEFYCYEKFLVTNQCTQIYEDLKGEIIPDFEYDENGSFIIMPRDEDLFIKQIKDRQMPGNMKFFNIENMQIYTFIRQSYYWNLIEKSNVYSKILAKEQEIYSSLLKMNDLFNSQIKIQSNS